MSGYRLEMEPTTDSTASGILLVSTVKCGSSSFSPRSSSLCERARTVSSDQSSSVELSSETSGWKAL